MFTTVRAEYSLHRIIVYHLEIVGTVYHLVIYMQSNKIHKVFLMSEFIHHLC